ncbi:MAG: Bcr/CflA family drug resistance efflux transporter [Desulfuromonas sp.]|uniref:multidrug effflux MFS transporter n=1 Tax=Desulfuromonas sp. TaxID=892 RepID=UPI000CBBA626|nr:multidrug effflux MFS transporter [Desulfuromonas sp.]PLX85347.1 MAG: Bcr/CflA family drug resistance efflux transporter [Desulfuromonas sp.]
MTKSRMLLLLALLSAFPPLATDMYLPAIPLLQQRWGEPLTVINLTLVGFFVSYCVFLLIYGPVSDRFGRRRPLLAGIGLFIFASLLCALSGSVGALIVSRVLQAAGAAAAAALAMAISKDVFRHDERARILAWIGVIMALAPAVAPIVGGWIMIWFSWRWIFVAQAAIAAVAWVGVLRMPETLQAPSSTGVLETAGIYLQLFRNRRYLGFALMVSMVVFPHFAFIAGSADIYITRLGLSEQTFGYLFAINAIAFMGGSLLCTRLLHRIGPRKVMTVGFAGLLAGGVIMLLRIFPGPWGLALPMSVVTFSLGLSRPPSNNLVLEQVDRHAGAASSLLVFIFFMLGAFSMWLISLDWGDKIGVIGILATAVGAVMLSIWLLLPSEWKCERGRRQAVG